jgi:hypothetical protein
MVARPSARPPGKQQRGRCVVVEAVCFWQSRSAECHARLSFPPCAFIARAHQPRPRPLESSFMTSLLYARTRCHRWANLWRLRALVVRTNHVPAFLRRRSLDQLARRVVGEPPAGGSKHAADSKVSCERGTAAGAPTEGGSDRVSALVEATLAWRGATSMKYTTAHSPITAKNGENENK